MENEQLRNNSELKMAPKAIKTPVDKVRDMMANRRYPHPAHSNRCKMQGTRSAFVIMSGKSAALPPRKINGQDQREETKKRNRPRSVGRLDGRDDARDDETI